MAIEIVSRSQWGARPPKSRTTIATPTPKLFLHHSAGAHRGAAGVRQIQSFHMDTRNYADIAYSFLIDGETLTIYEGRGAGVQGGHTRGHNSTSHAVCVMGNYETTAPTNALIDRIRQLVAHGHTQGWWPAQLTGGHRDVGSTACPGQHLYDAIPQINTPAEGPDVSTRIERLEEIAESLGYTITKDGTLDDREVAAFDNMAVGIRNLLARNKQLETFAAEQLAGIRQLAANASALAEQDLP